jgi:hypothetical protein
MFNILTVSNLQSLNDHSADRYDEPICGMLGTRRAAPVASIAAGVAFSTLKHFEHSGQSSLERLAMLAMSLQANDAIDQLFQPPPATSLAAIEQRQIQRQRGRRSRK